MLRSQFYGILEKNKTIKMLNQPVAASGSGGVAKVG